MLFSFLYYFSRNNPITVPISRSFKSIICFVRFTLSLVDKVTIGTYNLASVILNFEESPAVYKMQSLIQFNSRCILQLIYGISIDLQKLLKYLNGTNTFVFHRTICIINNICCFSYKSCFIFK